jgi:hypothetical protein
MMEFKHPLGLTSLVVIILTFVLFVVALFVKGWTKELLLEIGVFLVSVKLILMNLKNARAVEGIEKKLDQLLAKK